jgi:hypothetical protein
VNKEPASVSGLPMAVEWSCMPARSATRTIQYIRPAIRAHARWERTAWSVVIRLTPLRLNDMPIVRLHLQISSGFREVTLDFDDTFPFEFSTVRQAESSRTFQFDPLPVFLLLFFCQKQDTFCPRGPSILQNSRKFDLTSTSIRIMKKNCAASLVQEFLICSVCSRE